jgi:hypothetical protein
LLKKFLGWVLCWLLVETTIKLLVAEQPKPNTHVVCVQLCTPHSA